MSQGRGPVLLIAAPPLVVGMWLGLLMGLYPVVRLAGRED